MKTSKERIAEAMRIRNISQSKLTRDTGISKGAISSYLSGRYEPKQDSIYKLAKALDVSEAWLRCAVEKAGISKHITPHCLRHSYAAMMINEGIEIYTLSKLMGHTKIATTMNRYGHLYDEKRREVSKLLDTKWSKNYNINEKNVLN